MAQTGGVGSVPSPLSLRGSTSARTLVLIDGVRIEDAGFSSTALQHIMLDQVERVEIVRGNVSSLYGSNAVGGVIQVFTKRGKGAPAPSASIMAGSRNTTDVHVGYGGELGETRFNLSASRFDTKGFSAIDPALAPLANPDPDGYRNQGLSLSASHRLNRAHEIGVAVFSTEAWLDYDQPVFAAAHATSTAPNQELSMLQGWWEARFVEPWKSRVTAAENKDHRTDTLNGAFVNNVEHAHAPAHLGQRGARRAAARVHRSASKGATRRSTAARPSAATRCASATSARGAWAISGGSATTRLQANYRYEDYSRLRRRGHLLPRLRLRPHARPGASR